MLYIQQSLGADEELVHIGQFHWTFTLAAVLNIIWGFLLCVGAIWGALFIENNGWSPFPLGTLPADSLWEHNLLERIRALHPGVKLFAFFLFIFGILRFAQMMLVKATTEIAITNTRLVYKRGLVARYVGEMSIDRIEGVNVLQSVLGRLLNYGRVVVRGMGVGEVVLPPLRDPIAFRKAIDRARSV